MKTRRFLYSFSFLLIIIGVALEPSLSLFTNLTSIIVGKDGLITDYFIKGSQGSALLNAGLVGLITTTLLSFTNAQYDGNDVGAIFFTMAFALFGKNILNIWPILIGGFIYVKTHPEEHSGNLMQTAFFATSISPLVSEIIFVFETPLYFNIPLALICGLTIGYIVNIVADHMRVIHKNYSLFNTGIVIGIIGTIYVSVLRSFGYEITAQLLLDTNKNIHFYIIFAVIFVCMGIYGYLKVGNLKSFKTLIKSSCHCKDYIGTYGLETSMMNMALTGLLTLLVLYIFNVPLNGPTLGGVLSIVGFSGAGKNIINIIPTFIGVYFMSLVSVWNINDPSPVLIMLYLSGLAPITSTFGFVPGIVSVMITSAVALNTGVLHGGLNLYNTGYAIGFVCAFLVPILERIYPNRKECCSNA